MYKMLSVLLFAFTFSACKQIKEEQKVEIIKENTQLLGTWKLVYGDILENDSLVIKDLSKSDFIKIINETHFAFFNQRKNTAEGFYGGAGTYTLKGEVYKELLTYTSVNEVRGHEFPFTIEIKGDSLLQYGLEEVMEAGIKRHIVEKYIRIK